MTKKKHGYYLIFSMAILIATSFFAIGIGRFNISFSEVFDIIIKGISPNSVIDYSDSAQSVVFKLRIPRILVSILVGASLSVSGTIYQSIFRNKLVSPDILGVSNGASVGAALAMILGFSGMFTQICAFVIGALTVIISVCFAKVFKGSRDINLALAGLIVGGFMSSLLSFIKFAADVDEKLPEIVYWLMGSMASVTMKDAVVISLPCIVCISVAFMLSWKLNIISMGENEAKTLGVNVILVKCFYIVCATILTALSVCTCGIISWFGLMVPHLCRLLVGDDNCFLLPLSTFVGATLLVVLDTISRTVFISELPLGILSGIVGSMVFAVVLVVRRKHED